MTNAWIRTMESLIGVWVEVTLSDDGEQKATGVLENYTHDGEVCLRDKDGTLRWSWPNLHIRELSL